MNYFTVFTDILVKPSEFFKKEFNRDNFIHSLIFSIIILIITAVIGYFFDTIYLSRYFTIPGPIFIKDLFELLLIFYLFFTIGTIISFKLFGGKGSCKDTFMIVAYSTATLPLEYLPIFPIYIITGLYRLHICARGGQFVHNFSYWKSCFAVLLGWSIIPFLVFVIILQIYDNLVFFFVEILNLAQIISTFFTYG